jgi:hypothetical protein
MVTYLRARYRAGELSRERIGELERLPGWSWDPIHDQFDGRLRLLRDFMRREGRPDVPIDHLERGFALGLWVENKRARFRRGRLPRYQVRALEAVPGWSWRGKARDRRFQEVLSSLRTFVRRHGHLRVPEGYSVLGIRLKKWIIMQRESRRRGRLSRARVRALEAVPGWTWHPAADRFEEGMRRLRRYVEREGHSRVPRRHEERGFKLGVWVMDQRQRRRLGRLSAERARRLSRLPGWSWKLRERWLRGRPGSPNSSGLEKKKPGTPGGLPRRGSASGSRRSG